MAKAGSVGIPELLRDLLDTAPPRAQQAPGFVCQHLIPQLAPASSFPSQLPPQATFCPIELLGNDCNSRQILPMRLEECSYLIGKTLRLSTMTDQLLAIAFALNHRQGVAAGENLTQNGRIYGYTRV